MRYDTSGETFTGMAGTLGSLPAEVKRGIREANHNVITAKDPAHPNPSPYPENGTDKDSYFGDPLLRRAKPARDVQYGDYSLAASSPAFKLGFKTIPTDSIGLRKDFPFDKAAATRRAATDKIQAAEQREARMAWFRDARLRWRRGTKGPSSRFRPRRQATLSP